MNHRALFFGLEQHPLQCLLLECANSPLHFPSMDSSPLRRKQGLCQHRHWIVGIPTSSIRKSSINKSDQKRSSNYNHLRRFNSCSPSSSLPCSCSWLLECRGAVTVAAAWPSTLRASVASIAFASSLSASPPIEDAQASGGPSWNTGRLPQRAERRRKKLHVCWRVCSKAAVNQSINQATCIHNNDKGLVCR